VSEIARKVIVRLPNWVGDVVMATPALISLRKGFPESTITVIGKENARVLLDGLDLWDAYLPFDRHGMEAGTFKFLQVAGGIRRQRYDTGIILPNSQSSALLFALGGVKRRIGYARHGRGTLLTHPVPVKRKKGRFIPVPMVFYYLRLVEALGIKSATTHTELVVAPEDAAWSSELWQALGYQDGRPVVGITPGASFGPSKQWPPSYFSRVSDMMMGGLDTHVLFLPGPGEEPLMEEILRAAEGEPDVLAPEQTPLNRLKAIIQRCDLLLTNDTGPRHIAVALRRPVVVIMGPTDPRYTATDLEDTIILRKELPCSPCMLKACPKDHACMTLITPEEVFNECEQILQTPDF